MSEMKNLFSGNQKLIQQKVSGSLKIIDRFHRKLNDFLNRGFGARLDAFQQKRKTQRLKKYKNFEDD